MPDIRAILHVDMDAFFASLEQLDRPELRGKPVLVGGKGRRGVVAAASYEARAFGCHSAQPMAIARRACPQAIVVPPRGRRYREVSRRVFEILESFTPLVEPLSIDEAFLDVTGSQRLHGAPPRIAEAIKQRIHGELGVTASVGVAPNKFLAKLASDLEKPDGLTIIEPDCVVQTLEGLPISRMWGVGPATEKRFRALGVTTFGDLHRYPLEALESSFGIHARRMAQLARGIDQRVVVPDHQAKSISQEQTFAFDLEDPVSVREVLLGQVEQVGRRLRRHGYRTATVTIKIRYGEFKTVTRSRSFDEATDSTDSLWQAGRALFDEWAQTFRPVRLIGFGAGHLTTSSPQPGLFTEQADRRRRALDQATDTIQEKFGTASIRRGPPRQQRS
ncbi:MAG: DNA polymerase IV [Planctomycetota bacterium]|jgi:DNA polymerase-4